LDILIDASQSDPRGRQAKAEGRQPVMTKKGLVAVSMLASLVTADSARSFNTYGNGFGSKWDAPQFGTGAVVTWSFMAPGVGISNIPQLAHLSGTNSLGTGNADDIRAKIDTVHGAGAFDAAVRRAFATWTAATNIQFVEVGDPGSPMAGSTTPDIRIGAFHFPVNDPAGGAGYGPPGNDDAFPDALAGDLALNDRNRFVIATGPEGSPLPTDNGTYLNDVEGLMLHEIGHTLGLGHSDVVDGVMCGYIYPGDVFDGSACDYTRVNHQLHADDVAGIRAIYGAPTSGATPSRQVPLPGAVSWLLAMALASVVAARRRSG
jgi:hypothetical protein